MPKLLKIQRIDLVDNDGAIPVDITIDFDKYTIQGSLITPAFDYELEATVPNLLVYDGLTIEVDWDASFDDSTLKSVILFGVNVDAYIASKFTATFTYNFVKNAFDYSIITAAL